MLAAMTAQQVISTECPDADTILEFLRGSLSRDAAADVERHVDVCPDCRMLLADLIKSTAAPQLGTVEPNAAALINDSKRERQPRTESLVPVRIGDVIANKYHVRKVLGAGGMGVVVAADHMLLRQGVAVKFLLPSACQQEGVVERFLREARTAARIRSEHVARVLDVGALDDGSPYMVMELLAGNDMGALLRERGPLVVSEAIALVLQACEAVAEAHSLGIVHRDLKPANLFLTDRPDGSALLKVIDFGISKTLPHDQTHTDRVLTASSLVMGSPLYMSPEQIRGAKHVDERTDIWSLGVILYELLTGRVPFDAESITDLSVKLATQSAPPMLSIRSDIPAQLEAVVMRCLERELGARMPSVAALARALVPFGSVESAGAADRIARIQQGKRASLAPAEESFAAQAQSGGHHQQLPSPRSARHGWKTLGAIGVICLLGLGGAAGAWLARGGILLAGRRSPTTARGVTLPGSAFALPPPASQVTLPVEIPPLAATSPTMTSEAKRGSIQPATVKSSKAASATSGGKRRDPLDDQR